MADDMELTDIDQPTNDVIDSRVKSAMNLSSTTPEQEGQAFLKREENSPFSQNQMMGNAIKNRAQRRYDSDLSRLREMREINLNHNNFDKIMDVSALENQRYEFKKQREMAIKKRIMDQRSQRAQILSSILQVGGTIVGGAFGGPVGAVAGGAAGKAVAGSRVGGAAGSDDLSDVSDQA